MTWIVDDWRATLARDGRVALMPSRVQAQVCLGLAGLLAGLGVWAGFRGGWAYGRAGAGHRPRGRPSAYSRRLVRPRPLVVVTTSGIELRRRTVRWDEIDRIDATYRSTTDISIDLRAGTPACGSPGCTRTPNARTCCGSSTPSCTPGADRQLPASRVSALRTTAGSVVVHIGGRLALRKLP